MKALVIGGNFAGMTAAIELKRKLKDAVEVTLIDRNSDFLFVPSLIWVPFKRREITDITVDRRKVLAEKRVNFVLAEALSVDPEKQVVTTTKGLFNYDHLVIATGPKVDFDVAPGVRDYATYVGTPVGAMNIRKKLEEFIKHPGPIVVGATQRAGCMGAAYEFLFNLEEWLRAKKIRKKVDLYWVTPEPFLGHFGIEGMPLGEAMLKKFMQLFNIQYKLGVGIKEVTPYSVELTNGEVIETRFSMLMPPFKGVDFIHNSPALQPTANDFLEVGEDYRHLKYKNVWAAGLTVDVKPPFQQGSIPFSVPKTGYPSDETGKLVAENITRIVKGRTDLKRKAWGKIPGVCIMDAGKKEVIIISDHLFKPRKFALMIPNIFYDFSKVLLEKYFLWKIKNGYAHLP
jgi:sulfide:quinone oxidoreductase